MIRRDGTTVVSIDGKSWRCPAWKCDVCGETYWSYFDDDKDPGRMYGAYCIDDDEEEEDE